MPSIAYDPSKTALFHPEARETLFEPGKQYSTLQLAIETARLAYVRFEQSTQELARLTSAVQRVGFEPPEQFVDVRTDSQGFGAYRPADKLALVAFRGTQPNKLKDIGTDLEALPVPWPESGGLAHRGFASRAEVLLPKIRNWLDTQCRDRSSLLVTGHSLGAALATLVASVCRPAELVTIGSPRVGNAEFVDSITDLKCTRIVDCCDDVTEVPLAPGLYEHVGAPLYIDRNGATVQAPVGSSIASDRTAARIAYTLRYAWRPGMVLARGLADHAPINYLRAFF